MGGEKASDFLALAAAAAAATPPADFSFFFRGAFVCRACNYTGAAGKSGATATNITRLSGLSDVALRSCACLCSFSDFYVQ